VTITAEAAAPPANWTLALPGNVQAVLLDAETRGVAVDLTGTTEVFYEVFVPFIGANTNTGYLVDLALRALRASLRRYDVPGENITVIADAIRADVYSSRGFDAAFSALLRWVAIEDPEDDSADEDYMLDSADLF
jgi:hypothetical protein